MCFVKQLIYFHARNVRAGKKQMLHITTLQRTDTCGEMKYFAKYSLTAMPPLFQQAVQFPVDIHTQCHRNECIIFPYIIV
jgi:hypothetical protein